MDLQDEFGGISKADTKALRGQQKITIQGDKSLRDDGIFERQLNEPFEAIFDAPNLPLIFGDRRFHRGANDIVQSGAIATASKHTDAFDFRAHHILLKGAFGAYSNSPIARQ